MGNCSSTNATNPKANRGPKKFVRPRTDDDEKTEVDFDRLREEQRQRLAQEEEMNRLIYAEKAALKEITSRLIEKRASCESLMDLLEPSELVDISLDDSSFRAQKRVRRKLMKKNQVGETHEWMLYNNVDGIAEPHMVHLALFMQKVMTTLSRIEAIKSNQSQRHAKSEAQLTKLQLSPKGNVIIAPVTPPSSPITSSRTHHKGGRKTLQRHEDDSPPRESESESYNPFRTASCDSLEIPNDAATMAIIEQQRLLEEEYLRSKHEHKHHSHDEHNAHGQGHGHGHHGHGHGEGTGSHSSDHADGLPAAPDGSLAVGAPGSLGSGSQDRDKFSPPSPPPSPNGSPRSPSSAPYTPTGSPRIGDGTHTDTATSDTGALLTSASLCLRLGELLSPEDAQLLSGVQGGTSDLLENVRSSKSHAVNHQTLFASVSPEMQAQYRQELLSLQVCIIAPQTSYEITQANLYDYDLPPGLVTLRVAHTVMQLYRRGGRLTPKSVHKLLRLGYRSLHKKANTTQVSVLPGDTLTIVGDLHGQLPDLLHILQTSGLPSRTNKYIFNGDFVDRGAYGVEVMCTLLALHIAMPDHVILNRGNHEDFAICTAYGFQMECCEKYGDVIFGMFVEIFQQLPLFAIVNKSMLVLHGGLFHTTDTSLAELEAIDRAAFSLQDIPEGGDGITAISRSDRDQYLKQLVRDALWSDPADHDGLQASVRGAGVSFGADVTRAFLKANDLQFVVRSHECVRSGYNEPYSGPDKHLLCTIFSASDYGGSGNSAAILQFHIPTAEEISTHASSTSSKDTQEKGLPTLEQAVLQMESAEASQEDFPEFSELKFVQGTDLCYRVHHYFVAPNFFDQDTTALVDAHQSTTDLTVLHSTMQNTQLNSSPNAAAGAAAASFNDSPQPEGRTPTPAGDKDLPPKMTATGRSVSLQAPRKQSLDGKGMTIASSAASIAAANSADAAVTGTEAGRHNRSKSMTAYTGNLSFQHMGMDDEDGNDGLVVSDRDCVLIGSKMSLFEFIVSRLDELRKEFESVDKRSSGVVTKYQWVNVMREVMSLHIRWISLMQVLVLESHFRIYHGKKMVDYSAFLGSFNPEEEAEEFGELVTDEYTAALNANHSGSTKNNTTFNAGTAIANEAATESSRFEGDAEESGSVGLGSVQNKAPFSSLIASSSAVTTGAADAGSGSSSEEAQTDRETPSVDTSVGSPRDDDGLSATSANASASTSAGAPAVGAAGAVAVDSASLECDSAKVFTAPTVVTATTVAAAEGSANNSPLGSARKKVTFLGTDDADLASTAAVTNTSPLAAAGNSGGNAEGVTFSPDSTCSTSVDGMLTTALSPPVNSAHASMVQVPSRTRRTSSAAKLGRRNSESLIRSVDVSPPVLLPAQMYCSHRISRELMEVLYIDYKEVESAFRYFDRDSDGFIKSAEFRTACIELNKYLPRGQKIRDIDSLLMLMDFEETGEIAFNNFFELFRLSEMKLNVGIDDEDSLLSSLHHSDMKDVVLRQHSVSGYGSFSVSSPSKLAIHGVQINVDSEFPQSPHHVSKLTRGDSPLGLNIDA